MARWSSGMVAKWYSSLNYGICSSMTKAVVLGKL